MAMSGKGSPPHMAGDTYTGVTAGATAPTAEIIDVATKEKDRVAEKVQDDGHEIVAIDELEKEKPKPKKKPEAGLGNYFVSIFYAIGQVSLSSMMDADNE